MTSQDLVPQGGDYGARQSTVAAMQQAGLPLDSAVAGGTSGVVPAGLPPSGDQSGGAIPPGFDVFANRVPQASGVAGQVAGDAAPPPLLDTFRARAAVSDNVVLRELARLVSEYR